MNLDFDIEDKIKELVNEKEVLAFVLDKLENMEHQLDTTGDQMIVFQKRMIQLDQQIKVLERDLELQKEEEYYVYPQI